MRTETDFAFSRAWPLLLAACAIAACTPLKPSWSDSGLPSTDPDEMDAGPDGDWYEGGEPQIEGGEPPIWSEGGIDGGIDGDSGEPIVMVETCSQPGALRCAGSGRQSCVEGRWTATDPCQNGQACSAQPATQGMCLDVTAVCKGGGGQWQCDEKGVLIECSAEGVSKSASDCSSPRLCELGRATGKCATCVPGTHRCSERQLERCNDTGMGYALVTTCDTAALCNATAGACTSSACLAGRFNCQGDMLRRCNADQSGWEPVMPCGVGLCDEVGGQCDVCTPGNKSCNMGASRTCNATGQGYTSAPCMGTTSVCVGNGQCVQCDSNDDCPDPGACRTRHCDLGTGTCQPQLAAARATCSGGLCNAQGMCVQCLSATSDCPAETNPCRMATCNGTCGSANRTSGSCTLSGGGSGVCSAGSCVQCASSGDCPSARPYCVSSQCRPCNGGCAVGGSCSAAADCSSNICTSGTCRPSCSGSCGIGASCSVNGDCASNVCGSDKRCSECRDSQSSLCPPGDYCQVDTCNEAVERCSTTNDCRWRSASGLTQCMSGLCLYSPISSCPPAPGGWSYLAYANLTDIFTHNAGAPMCLLLCTGSCPNGYSCQFRTHTNPQDNTTSMVRVCWANHWN